MHKQKKLQRLNLGQLDRLTPNLNTTGSLDVDLFSLVVLLYVSTTRMNVDTFSLTAIFRAC